MVYGLLRALPGDHRFVDPVIRATRWRLANLTPASGRQNHTASPSASGALVSRTARGHRIPPRERGDRVSPLCWDGTAETMLLIFRIVKGYFRKSEVNPTCGGGRQTALSASASARLRASPGMPVRHRKHHLPHQLIESAAHVPNSRSRVGKRRPAEIAVCPHGNCCRSVQ